MKPSWTRQISLAPLLFCLLFTTMVPISHSHIEAWLEPGHNHAWDSAIVQVDLTRAAFPRNAGNLSDNEFELNHSHLLVEIGGVSLSRKEPTSMIPLLFHMLPCHCRCRSPLLCKTGNAILREFPGNPSKDALPRFTGSSPPTV